MLKKVILAVLLAVLCVSLLGCSTVAGAGEDIKWMGEKGAEALE